MGLKQMRIGWDNPDAKPIGSALRRRDRPLIDVIPIPTLALTFCQLGDRRITQGVILRFAVLGFHPHMFWLNRSEMNRGRDLERFADLNLLSILVLDLHISDLDLRPVFSHLCFPAT